MKGTKLKRRSTRHVSEITAIASEYGNSAKIIVPRSWLGKRVIAFLHSDYISDDLSFNDIFYVGITFHSRNLLISDSWNWVTKNDSDYYMVIFSVGK